MRSTEHETRVLASAVRSAELLRLIDSNPQAAHNMAVASAATVSCGRRVSGVNAPLTVDGFPLLSRPQFNRVAESVEIAAEVDSLLVELQRRVAQIPNAGLEINLLSYVSAMRGNLGFVVGELQRAESRHAYAAERLAPKLPALPARGQRA